MSRLNFCLTLLGAAALLPYLAAYGLSDLRKNTIGFEVVFFAAFALYLGAVVLVLQWPAHASRFTLGLIAGYAVVFRLMLLPTPPTLSDDMFRYVWDGRVQAAGLSPYRYPPAATELSILRLELKSVWPSINRREFVTVYPPFAQMVYAATWRVVGSTVSGFKALLVLAELLAGLILLVILRVLKQPLTHILIYAWSPLLIFEVAHAGHVDGMLLLLLCAAWLARLTDHDGLLGIFLGLAIALKFLPLLLLPALVPLPANWLARLRTQPAVLARALTVGLTLSAVIAGVYLPYLAWGAGVIGFLPHYFGENFNMGLARLLFNLAEALALPQASVSNGVTFGGLVVMGVGCILRPPTMGREALARCVWFIGWFTLFTQNLFSWYFLWALPLLTVFVQPGKFLGFRLDGWTAWLLFSGSVMLSYLFFVHWRINEAAQWAEYGPLYILLILAGLQRLNHWHTRPASLAQPIENLS